MSNQCSVHYMAEGRQGGREDEGPSGGPLGCRGAREAEGLMGRGRDGPVLNYKSLFKLQHFFSYGNLS